LRSRGVIPALCFLAACADEAPCGWSKVAPDPSPAERNVLLVVLDDVGADQLVPYADGTLAPTPTIDCRCDQGVTFERAWTAPKCSPGRAAAQTGRLADRTGIGQNVDPDLEMAAEEITLAETIGPYGYTSAVAGKWHLSAWGTDEPLLDPMQQGYDSFYGTPANLLGGGQPDAPDDKSFESFWRSVDGELRWTTGYATTVTTNDALSSSTGRASRGCWSSRTTRRTSRSTSRRSTS
jgi:arylsulfatase A-like enzyme